MERKNNNLIILVVTLTLLIVGLGGYFIYDKVLSDNTNKENNINNNNTNNNQIYTNVNMAGTYSFTKEHQDSQVIASMDLTLNADGTAILSAGNGQVMREWTKGTYKIENTGEYDRLLYTRIFSKGMFDSSNEFINLTDSQLLEADLSKTEIFIINNKNALHLDSYDFIPVVTGAFVLNKQ